MDTVVIGITGHRLLSAEQKEKIKPVVIRALQNIVFIIREHDESVPVIALSPLAEGADTLFAHAARSIGLPLKVILPFERDEYLKDFSSGEARHEFDRLYNEVGDENRSVLNHAGDKEVNQLYMEVGQKIVNESHYIIAIWNEKPGNGKGGTADVVAYAMEKKKDILIINPEDEHPFINYLNLDKFKHRGRDEIIESLETSHLTIDINSKQEEYDANAGKFNKKYRRLWTLGFVLGLVEVCAFSVIVSFHVHLALHFWLASIEFFSIVTIVMFVLFGNSTMLHKNYVHYRIISERLRIKRFFAELGFRIYHTPVSPIYLSFNEKPEFNILDNTIKLINLSAYSYLPFETKKQKLEQELIIDQRDYHEYKKAKFEKRNRLYKKVRKFLFLLFIAAVTLHFAHVSNEYFVEMGIRVSDWDPPLFHSIVFEEVILFLSIFIPATIAACEALKYLYEWEKIISLSAAMAGYFGEKSKKLKNINSESHLEELLNAINSDMLVENLDWEKYMQDKSEVPT